MEMNGYFKRTDIKRTEIMGCPIEEAWWSRVYEYPWAFNFATFADIAADMGCGWMQRPFKNMIQPICKHIYAVDIDKRVLLHEPYENITYVVGDMTKRIDAVPEGRIDKLFCISVLEDIGDKLPFALSEFYRLLTDDGLVIATFDVWYDRLEPLGQYPGIEPEYFFECAKATGFVPVGNVSYDKTDLVFSPDFNLCCYHAVLEKA